MYSSSEQNYLIAVDGSPAAHLGFQVVMENLLKPSDRMHVAHVFNPEKTFLAYDMQPQNLHKTYETQTLLLGPRAVLLWEQANPAMSTKEQVVELGREYGTNLTVVGMHGRKGAKE